MACCAVGPFDWVIRFVMTWLLIFTLSCILLRPLWKLTKSRPSLIIVFSRAIGNLLRLFGDMPNFIVYNIFNIPMTPENFYYLAYTYSLNGYLRTMLTIPHVHNLALAVNRSHAMFFPFHYNMVFAKKKNIYVLCLGLWLISICIGGSDHFFRTMTNNSFSPLNELTAYSISISTLFYIALGCRMLWIRYKSSSTNGASIEKDSIKILIVCFSCLTMSAMNKFIFAPFVTFANTNFPDTPRLVVYWGSYTSQWLILCTEEICLALLVRDFRQNVKQQLEWLFCCCRGNKGIMNNSNNTATRTGPIRVVQVTKVNTLVMNRN